MSEMNLNLIPSKVKFQAARIKLQKKIRLIIMIVLILWLSAGALVVGATGIVSFQVNAAQVELEKRQKEYLGLEDNIVVNQKLKYRAKMVGGVLNNRFEYGKSFETVSSLFPESINLKDFDLQEGSVFEVRGITQGKDNMNLLEKTIESVNLGLNDKLKSAKIVTLALNQGVWEFTLEVKLK